MVNYPHDLTYDHATIATLEAAVNYFSASENVSEQGWIKVPFFPTASFHWN